MKTILIVGATGGVGERLVQTLAGDSLLHLILVARNQDKVEKLKQKISGTNVKVTIHIADLSKKDDVEKLIIDLQQYQIDVYINNAGIGSFDYVGNIKDEDLERLFRINVLAPIQITNGIVNQMYSRGHGHIIYVCSMLSKFAFANTSLYSSTKHALRGFANALRLEAKEKGIKVSVVNPNAIENDFFKNAKADGSFIRKYTKQFLSVSYVANKIIKLIEKPREEIDLPSSLGCLYKLYIQAPSFFNKFIYMKQKKKQ
ncbi:SDR family NAD(P)-dependent oxidoreductase [Ureaplasma canigenitalium]|uniref:SDR family NAD(P)-dependent oxidoreductase n=1 Tax=Ureaplasma canigenitalium TaxID=42092 RepID=UPI00068ADB2E|nr:SDR family NAD(P)-dependent oxidoreductase [Ureaplasma canigenitalium]